MASENPTPLWRPMTTAPKDGTPILLCRGDRVTVGEWAEVTDYAPEYHASTGEYLGQSAQGYKEFWNTWDGGFSEEAPPTGWQPLPRGEDTRLTAPLVIRVAGEPVPQNVGKVGRWRSKDGREGTTIRQPSKVRHYKIEVQERMRLACQRARPGSDSGTLVTFFGDAPLRLEILAVFELPKSRHRKRNPPGRTPHTGRYGNCDNLTKAIADAGEHVLWVDDGQICELVVRKFWGSQGEPPFVEVRVSVVEASETLFEEMIR